MKKFLLAFIILVSCYDAMAIHTKGGWMYYEYLGPGINNPANLRYKIGLNYYIDPLSGTIESSYNFSIFQGSSPFSFVMDASVSLGTNVNSQNCTSATCYPCIALPIPSIGYRILNYETTVELPPIPGGYIIAKQRCCRVNNISNVLPPSSNIGETYTISIPGTVAGVANAYNNHSPRFFYNDTAIVCAQNPFSINFSATDADGDSLVYSFCDAFTGANASNPDPASSTSPPFSTIPYSSPFTGTSPLGSLATISPQTGIVSGTAPAIGEYVVCICVAEYRNGIHFADSRKELHLKVAACDPVVATLDPTFITCGDLNLTFHNGSDGPAIQSWIWTFGDPASGAANTSPDQIASHQFSAPGVYTVKLVVNLGLPCVDSAEQQVSVFPGFFTGFQSTAPYCTGVPIQFGDTTRTNFGTVSYWSWNFGNTAILSDTSHNQNPSYTYPAAGPYTVQLISGNSLGCRDTTFHDIMVNPSPVLNVISPDSTYCGLDSLQLSASGTGNFTWTPATNIIGANTATPIVFPTVPTTYTATLESQGCIATDSVRLTPLFDLSNNIAANPASICAEDTLLLSGSSNKTNVRWLWSPAATLASPASQNTQAFPMVTSSYTLQTWWGNHCVVSKTISIPVTPLAIPNAGPDTSYCFSQTPVPLTASGGTTYTWSPSAGLSATNIPNPTAAPSVTTPYIVSVGVNGCSKTKADTVWVNLRTKPTLSVTNDTLICVTDTLQLNQNTGPGSVLWSPNYMISNVNSPAPLVSPDIPTLYRVRFTDIFGCFNDDSVFVDVKAQVTIDAGNDTSVCKTEGYTLRTTGDALSYTWIPTQFLSNPNIKNPVATPPVTTTYTVIGNIGKCQAQSDVKITVAPYPVAYAGPDTIICFGKDAQLSASGGSSYTWTPSNFLNSTTIANPTALRPRATITYIVTVTDTLGCPRAINDTVVVTVIPALHVNAGPPDTTIVEDEPLLLTATGASTYIWSPTTALNNPLIPNPVATPRDSIRYYVIGADSHGCFGADSINVYVFSMDADMYVPTAFTPNGDGNNDVSRPILIGMRSLNYFRIYNRFGEMVFSTSQIEAGWNGIYKGKPQDPATFVWMAEGVTYKGQLRRKKGYVVLIR